MKLLLLDFPIHLKLWKLQQENPITTSTSLVVQHHYFPIWSKQKEEKKSLKWWIKRAGEGLPWQKQPHFDQSWEAEQCPHVIALQLSTSFSSVN
jgi:hypothetical protein